MQQPTQNRCVLARLISSCLHSALPRSCKRVEPGLHKVGEIRVCYETEVHVGCRSLDVRFVYILAAASHNHGTG